MSTGIILPSLFSIATSTSEALIFGSNPSNSAKNQIGLISYDGAWTPPQYSQPALTVLTVNVPNSSNGQSNQASYVFDAVFKISHRRTSHKTSHPVLTGANISDHVYILPSRVTLDIGMSDAMSSFENGVWVGSSTKSISAWQILKNLQISKSLVTLTTRLDTYSNMVIIDSSSPDENKTKHGLRATFVLEELLSASVLSIASQSARPQTSNSTQAGTVQSVSPNSSQVEQNVIPSPLYPSVNTYPQVPGAGRVSSNSLSQLNSGPSQTP